MKVIFLLVSILSVTIIKHGSSLTLSSRFPSHARNNFRRSCNNDRARSSPLSSTTQDVLIFGNGNVGKAVLSCLIQTEEQPQHSNTFQKQKLQWSSNSTIFCSYTKSPPIDPVPGVEYVQFNQTPSVLQSCSHILITIPPIMKDDNFNYTDAILDHHPGKRSRRILDSISDGAWVGYVSTTGVYGNHDGEWVDETSDTLCQPGTKAMAYLDIERRWAEMRHINTTIFRCGGLYGENFSALHTVRNGNGRSVGSVSGGGGGGDFPTRTKGRRNQLPGKEGGKEAQISRVHLMDVAQAIVAAMMQSQLINGVVNLADSLPAPRSEVMQYAYKLLLDSNIALLERFENANAQTGNGLGPERRRRRSKDKKKVSNQKMISLLEKDFGGKLLFPSYREGLQHVLSQNFDGWSKKE